MAEVVRPLALAARQAARELAALSADRRTDAIKAIAAALRLHSANILAANALDMAAAPHLSQPLRDRLLLTPERLEAVAVGVEAVAAIPDPVGRVLADWTQPNGLQFQRVAVPLGVIGIIYESRPNVTADAAALCVRSGNACILRGGSDSFKTSLAMHSAIQAGLASVGLPLAAVQMVATTDRAAVGEMLAATGLIDVIIPRGGKSLVARVEAESRVPVFAHLEGICHVYVHEAADAAMAERVVLNAKLRRTSVCGAAETLLVDEASPLLAPLVKALLNAGCAVRGDGAVQAVDTRVTAASEDDWRTEYLDAIISVKQVAGLDAAINHVNTYGSHHTDSIVTEDAAAAADFLAKVDSAIVLHNASTQFADGGEFGFGAEIGIATGKLHARGPVGAEQLTTYKYVVRGNGQIRG